MDACMEVDGRVGERIYIYQKGYQHGQAIQLLSVIMLRDLRVTACVCSEHTQCLISYYFGSAVMLVTYFVNFR